jgi:hypothetical protein
MGAEIIDDVLEEENLQEGETFADPAEDEPVEQELQEPVQEPEEEDVPDEFRGKSAAELARIIQDRNQTIDRQGSELGYMRKTFDSVANQNAQQSVPAQPEPVSDEPVDFFVDPQRAVDQRIASHPALKQAEETSKKLHQAQGQQYILAKHPDAKEILSSNEFASWIQGSPARLRRFQYADSQGDIEEADDLLTTFKELKGSVSNARQAEAQAQKKAVSAAAVGSTRGNSDAVTSKRIYRSSDLRKIMRENPKLYEEREDEYTLAYIEGRVR